MSNKENIQRLFNIVGSLEYAIEMLQRRIKELETTTNKLTPTTMMKIGLNEVPAPPDPAFTQLTKIPDRPDTGISEKPPRKRKSEERQRTAVAATRLLPEEYETLSNAADEQKVSLSEYLRIAALNYALN